MVNGSPQENNQKKSEFYPSSQSGTTSWLLQQCPHSQYISWSVTPSCIMWSYHASQPMKQTHKYDTYTKHIRTHIIDKVIMLLFEVNLLILA